MPEKVCVITGATSGIGLATAEALAMLGARIVLIGRDLARGDAALRRLRRRAPGAQVSVHYADLARMREVRRLGAELRAAYPRIDVLVNNAGAQFERRTVTEDGLERTFALNHMAYFILTYELSGCLAASAPARVINVASEAHEGARMDFADLNLERGYSGWLAYSRSKLANILFTRELARRVGPAGITANALHPGFVASRFGYNNPGFFRIKLFLVKRLLAISPKEGAEGIVRLAVAPELATATGGFYVRSLPAEPSAAGRDDAAARQLWDASNEIAGLSAVQWTAALGEMPAQVDNADAADLQGIKSAGEPTSSDDRAMPPDVSSSTEAHYAGVEGERYHRAKFWVPPATLSWVTRVRAAKFARFVAPTDRVVEFGVGAGWNLAALECRERTGIDIGQHLAPALQAQGIGFVERATALADDSADALICHHVLEHVLNPADTLAELRRLLAPAGRLLLFVPYESESRYRHFDPGEPNHHLFAWNAQTLGNLVADCGFKVLSADVVRYGYERAAAVLAHRLRLGETGFRLLRGLAQLLRPAREVRIVATKVPARAPAGTRP